MYNFINVFFKIKKVAAVSFYVPQRLFTMQQKFIGGIIPAYKVLLCFLIFVCL